MKRLFAFSFLSLYAACFALAGSPSVFCSFDHAVNLYGFDSDAVPDPYAINRELLMDGRVVAGCLFVRFPVTVSIAVEADTREKEFAFHDLLFTWFGDRRSFSIGIQNVLWGEGYLSNPVFFLEKVIPTESVFSLDGNESRSLMVKFDQYIGNCSLSLLYASDRDFLDADDPLPWQSAIVRGEIPFEKVTLECQLGYLYSDDCVFYDGESSTFHEGLSLKYLFYKNNTLQFSQGLTAPVGFSTSNNEWNLACTLLNGSNELYAVPEIYSKDNQLFAGCSFGYSPGNTGVSANFGVNYDLEHPGYNLFAAGTLPLSDKLSFHDRLSYYKAVDSDSSFGKNVVYKIDALLSVRY